MDPQQLRKTISDTLQAIGLCSEDAVELLMMVAAHESGLGHYLYQVGGTALGAWETEPATYNDILKNYLDYRITLKLIILKALNMQIMPDASFLAHNLRLAIIMARLQFLRHPDPLPDKSDLVAMGALCKAVFNSAKGKATAQEYIDDYRRLVVSKYI